MFKQISTLFLTLATALPATALAGAAAARDQVPAETRVAPWSGAVPGCAENMVLYKVAHRFGRTESRYWNSNLAIDGFDHVTELAYRPYGADFIPRRYCSARAWMSDGERRTVYYTVTEAMGRPGPGLLNAGYEPYGVEYCIVGLDRGWAYPPACRSFRPRN
ncbi:hypothetical protein ACFFJB_03355 [Camelimonas abortus]|uniref:Uncharacterized protein n=1 Tax=Camelimonas abortus TaxID=1017184 RepID=A0ABV7LBJ1_9HYPH